MNISGKPKGKKKTKCCIDLGSSYFRKLTVDVEPGVDGLSVGDHVEERVYIGWGEEIAREGVISKGTVERAADILGQLTGDLVGRDDVQLTVVATNVLRVASNRDEARKYLEAAAGVKINILSTRGEALLGFAGVTSGLEHGIPVIVLDMGGTSTEISWGVVPAGSAYASVPLGVHSHFDPDTVTGSIAEVFHESGVPVRDSSLPGRDESHTIMLTGGTAVSLAAAWRQMNGEKYDDAVPVGLLITEFEKVCDWLSGLYGSGKEQQLALPPERIKLLPQGIGLIRKFIRALGTDRITITARDLRWGVVLGDGILKWGYLADEQESPDSR